MSDRSPKQESRRVKQNVGFADAKSREAEAQMHDTRLVSADTLTVAASEAGVQEGSLATTVGRLCLNMIVKNEMANLERCLSSVAGYIDCWVIGDTGSTDGTQEFIRGFFAQRNLPGELHSFPFHNFEQARNAALDCAYASPLTYDYLLLADADMELVVEDKDFRKKLNAPCYQLLQRSSVSYWNPRIVRRNAGARYHGVTHEYLGVPGDGGARLQGVWYKDHASGSNRVDKFERDIRLLLEGLKQEPDNVRYWFYLAQSYRDAGRTAEAAAAYAKRAGMGGWDEEAWYAHLQQARCLLKLNDEAGFLREALAAFNQRPQRVEPLYDLARFYRERGMNEASLLFSEPGLSMQQPAQDVLFLEEFVYSAGLKEEYSIAANYSRDPGRKDRGFAACNWLALNRHGPARTRNLARSNLKFYVQPARVMMPSFTELAIGFTPPEGYRTMNPSVTRHHDQLVMVQRCANFIVTEGRYVSSDGGPIKTRNFLLRLDNDLRTLSAQEILPPRDLPPAQSQRIQGFEDARLFSWRDALWFSACFRELNADARAEQALVRIDESNPGECRLTDLQMLRPTGPQQPQKNWMPQVDGEMLQFIYFCDPTRVIAQSLETVSETIPPIAAEHFRGGSQAISFDGGWLSLIHEVEISGNRRHYHHRFVWFDESNRLSRLSRPFFFEHRGIEYAAGLAWHPDGVRLIVSYGVDDRDSRIAMVDAREARLLLEQADQLPSGVASIQDRTGPPFSVGSQPATTEHTVVADDQAKGSDQERTWHACLEEARRLRGLNDEVGFVQNAIKAFNQRPYRAEPLYHLAKHYRERGMNAASVLFSEPGLAISWPKQDALFVEKYAYEAGLREEYSIAANYARDPARKDRGFSACNWLALNRQIPQATRNLARSNLRYYAQPAHAVMRSFNAHEVSFMPPDGFRCMNPSVTRRDKDLLVIQRAVNYLIGEDGVIQAPDNIFITRNFLLRLNPSLEVLSSTEILAPDDLTQPSYGRVRGFEDARPFVWRGALWCSAATRELSEDGWHQQLLARVEENSNGSCQFADWRPLRPSGRRQYEKNWIPLVVGDALRFVYLCDPTRILDQRAQIVTETIPSIACESFRGSSQAIAFQNGWLMLVHEVIGNGGHRRYHHRFVWFDGSLRLCRVSRPFYLEHHGVEFANGLAWHPDDTHLVVCYGIEDSQARIATIDATDVEHMLDEVQAPSSEARHKEREFESRQPVVTVPLAQEQKPGIKAKPFSASKLNFIIGVPRSGTTLFRAMLGAHPMICAPSETPWLTGAYGAPPSLRELLRNLAEAEDGPVKNIKGVSKADVRRAAQAFILELFSTKMRDDSKEILVLKTPDDIWFVDDLLEFFPDAHIFHIRRDVRDVALSTVKARFSILNHFGENNFPNAVARWIACETKMAEIAKAHANIHSFRFEDLLANPEKELKRAATICGVRYDARMLDYGSHITDAPRWEAGSRDVMRQTSLNAARAWAHRTITPTPEQRQVIEKYAEQIEALGYPRDWQREPEPNVQPKPDPIAKPKSDWAPKVPLAGTELMEAGLRERLGEELERINLQVNHPGHDRADRRPRVVWMHHDIDQKWVQWCKNSELVRSVDCFVFVSYWQRQRYINAFHLPPERCIVLRHALDVSPDARRWDEGPIWRCAYTSTPFRGLSVLLDAWQRLSPANAELHVWSSMKLYLEDDAPYQHLYKRAESIPGVIYHGLAPNPELRAALRSMHFLAYPSTFAETACLAVIEAMAAGCRIIVPSLGALPETTSGYGRIYPWTPDAEQHAVAFSEVLAAELASPWEGNSTLSQSQQAHCRAVYDWPGRLREWRQLIGWMCDRR